MKYTEILQEKIQKIKQDQSNATILLLEDSALHQAQEIERKQKAGERLGELAGLTIGVKDLFLLQGEKCTGASKMLENYIAPYTATAVQKLIDQDAIILTKDNCDMFGHGNTNENSYFGPVKNAIDPSRVAGGSSGGTAVNVALGNVDIGIGSDTGGSIRQPAVYNGVVGFKPSYGKISRFGLMSYASSLDTVGIIAKELKDIVRIFNTIAGKDINDFTSSEHTPLTEKEVEKYSLKGKKIGFYPSFLDYKGLDSEIREMIQDTLKMVEQLGAEIKTLEFFNEDLLVATYYTIAMAETASNLSRLDGVNYGYRSPHANNTEEVYLDSRNEGLSEETKRRIILGNQILSEGEGAKYYKKARGAREKIIQKFDEQFKEVDFIISPVVPGKAPKLGERKVEDPLTGYMSDLYTVGFSLGKIPSLALPSKKGIGLQISGAYNNDNEVLKAGYIIEKLLRKI